ncbi:hypothetical protein SK128_026504 [Halocaridina rubra]|uniref:Uncharacterized protein n=1 Tax=Halocaridina rubra TaxID=373956 RepID=A0AAN8XLZ2_HALRR
MTHAIPTQPNPTQPNPTQPNPTQPNPTQPNPTHLTPPQPNNLWGRSLEIRVHFLIFCSLGI